MAAADNTVLLVDDEPALVMVMSMYLERLGYRVASAPDGATAWGIIERDPAAVKIAFLDGGLGGMPTEELGCRLLAANPDAHVVVASGYLADTSQMEAIGPGRVSLLPKPFTAEELAAQVRRVLG
jgi:DNA-binding NtrC family response regulator